MSVSSVGGRVSNLMQSQLLLSALRNEQSKLNRVQEQMTSGNKLLAASDDSVAASQLTRLGAMLSRLNQYQSNTSYAQTLFKEADQAMGEAMDLVRQAQSLGTQSIGSTASDSERAANAALLDSLISQLVRVASRDYQGKNLFDGQSGAGAPFSFLAGGVLYSGNADSFRFAMDDGWQMDVDLSGSRIFGSRSGQANVGADLDPIMTGDTPLSDLNGGLGHGIRLSAVRVSDGVNPLVAVDLDGCATVGDVIDRLEACGLGLSVTVNATGHGLDISGPPGSDLTISDIGAGFAAADLGMTASAAGATVSGGDVDPRVTSQTLLMDLRGGAGIDATGIAVTNGSLSQTFDFAGATTVGDVLNRLNHSSLGIRAELTADGSGLAVYNVLAGGSLQITENGGSTAADLGLRTFDGGLALADLNQGRGLTRVQGEADFRITQRDGSTIDVCLDGATTIDDVIAAINGAADNTGDLVASISDTGGIQLVDASVDGGTPLSVAALNLSSAADDLGLTMTAVGDTLTGGDVSGVPCDGVFSHLLALRDAMTSNDSSALAYWSAKVQDDLDGLTEVRGDIGAQAAQVNSQSDRLTDSVLDRQSLISNLNDVDLTEAAVLFQQIQSQMTASMMTAGQLLNVSLLDFLT